jgi:hypothetical protein
MSPTIPVINQNITINDIHIAFDEPAALNAPEGLEAASTIAQIGIANPTRPITATVSRSGPNTSPVTMHLRCWH